MIWQAGQIFAADGFLDFLGDDAVPWSWRVLNVDGNVGHGVEVHGMESARATSTGVVAVYCLSGAGRLISMLAYRVGRAQWASVIKELDEGG